LLANTAVTMDFKLLCTQQSAAVHFILICGKDEAPKTCRFCEHTVYTISKFQMHTASKVNNEWPI